MAAIDKNSFLAIVQNPFKFRLFLLNKLPAGFFTGLRIKEITREKCVVAVPYKWFNKNPFRSTYFASLAMAAELSTGIMAMANVYGKKPAVSMLVTGLESQYFKKATGKTYFTCVDGIAFEKVVETAVATGEGQTMQAISTGKNDAGETVAVFKIIWSFKVKKAD